jgi:hypothetical protein
MATNTATFYPIDPELPRRGQYGTQEDDNFANLIQAANSTSSQPHPIQRTEPAKRKRSPSVCSDSSSLKRSKSLNYPHNLSRSQSPFRSGVSHSDSSSHPEHGQRSIADPSAALFRSKSLRTPAKKYTRPPTKDVFQSLKIGTEEWVRLEAEAKAFMLDETHPERQASVGNRNLVTSNDTKIHLFKTVQKFLADGAGALYFGSASAERFASDGERWLYPRDEDRLIALLTPLMRRMVTNERQRQYARRTRQSGIGGKSVEPEGLGTILEVSLPVISCLPLRSSAPFCSPIIKMQPLCPSKIHCSLLKLFSYFP